MAKNCAVKGKKRLLSFESCTLNFSQLMMGIKANLQCLLVIVSYAQPFKSLVSAKVSKSSSLFCCCLTQNETTAVNVNHRWSGAFQGNDWACSLQTGQRWRPRNGTFWWWWWWRLSALSQQWTQVMTGFLQLLWSRWLGHKKRLNWFFAFPDMALLFALSTDSLWRTFLHGSAGR